jgi:hypothetical protein
MSKIGNVKNRDNPIANHREQLSEISETVDSQSAKYWTRITGPSQAGNFRVRGSSLW